jgi:hypothetical protein
VLSCYCVPIRMGRVHEQTLPTYAPISWCCVPGYEITEMVVGGNVVFRGKQLEMEKYVKRNVNLNR